MTVVATTRGVAVHTSGVAGEEDGDGFPQPVLSEELVPHDVADEDDADIASRLAAKQR
jgi:hypothetical protein